MPDRKAPIALHQTFTPQEYERLKRGLVPQAIDVPFPGPSADENDNAALIKHVFVGYARAQACLRRIRTC
jgi:hypothetical protein